MTTKRHMTGVAAQPSFWKTGHRGTLLSAFFYTEVSFMAWILLGPLAVHVAGQLALSAAQVGALVALPILVGTLLRLPAGMLVDHLGARRVGIAAQVLAGVALLVLWRVDLAHVHEVYLLGMLLGVAGVSFSVAMPLVSAWYPPEHQGTALGITALGGGGTVLAAWAAPRLADLFGWQAVFGYALIPVLAGLALFAACAEEGGERPAPRPLTHYLYVLRYGDALWFSFFYAVTFGGFVSLASSLVAYFHDQFQLTPAASGSLTALCILGGTLFRPAGGWLADRVGGIRTLQIVFAVIALVLLLLAMAPPTALVLATAGVLVAMSGLGVGNGALFQLIPLRFFRQMGVVTGLVGTAGGLSGFALAAAFGLLREATGGYRAGFLLYAGLALVALAGLWSVKQRWRTTWGAPQVTSAKV